MPDHKFERLRDVLWSDSSCSSKLSIPIQLQIASLLRGVRELPGLCHSAKTFATFGLETRSTFSGYRASTNTTNNPCGNIAGVSPLPRVLAWRRVQAQPIYGAGADRALTAAPDWSDRR